MSARKTTGSRVGLPRFPRRKLTCRSRRRCAGANGSALENASGMSVSTGWRVFGTLAIGAPDVVIAYIEGGINWHHGDAQELAKKVYLNRGELPPALCDRSPCANPGT